MLESPVDVIEATVQIDQPLATGGRTVGTGFLVATTAPDGRRRVVLVTADHVLRGMPGARASIGYRLAKSDGSWRFSPSSLEIRDKTGAPLWTRHPARDVAAIRVTAPEAFARAAIPASYLATGESAAGRQLRPGEELLVLGFPRGLSANSAGFPILRAGRIASYPLTPQTYPTFLLDFAVFPGNSGGPVFAAGAGRVPGGPVGPLIAGLLTQQVELDDERMEIGVVTHARYVAETLALLEDPTAPVRVAREPEVRGATPAASRPAREGFARLFDELSRWTTAAPGALSASWRDLVSGAGRLLGFVRA